MNLLEKWQIAVDYINKIDEEVLRASKEDAPEVSFTAVRFKPKPDETLWKHFRDIYVLHLAGNAGDKATFLMLKKWIRYHRIGWKVGFKMDAASAGRFLDNIVETSKLDKD